MLAERNAGSALDKETRARLEALAERNERMAQWPTGKAHCTAEANAQIARDIREALAALDEAETYTLRPVLDPEASSRYMMRLKLGIEE